MKSIACLLLSLIISTSANCQEWQIPIKDYVVVYNAASSHPVYDTGKTLLLRLVNVQDSSATFYQEIHNSNGVVVNAPSNLTVPRAAVKLLFDYKYNLPAINQYLAFYYLEAIKQE